MKRRLTLHRETVRVLRDELARVRGGVKNTEPVTADCQTDGCDTWTNPVATNACGTTIGSINPDCTFWCQSAVVRC